MTSLFRLLHPRALPALLVLLSCSWLTASAQAAKRSFDIPAGKAEATLKAFAEQAGAQFFFSAEKVGGVRTAPVKGEFAARDALDWMLKDSGLVAVQDEKTGALSVRRDDSPNAPRVAQEEAATPTSQGKVEDGKLVLDKFEVFGSKSINADIPRSRDDVQPYVVFSHDQIEQANVANLDEFFRTRLPMNNPGATTLTGPLTGSINTSSINLRGLGSNQTLILVDGRRLPAQSTTGGGVGSAQGDLNGIPLAMIERIEILPSTASGIYGGGATGGVINIITRKDYSGVEATLSYANTFDTDASVQRVDINGSFSLQGGRTFLTVALSYTDGTSLLVQDRDIIPRTRALQLANNPAAFYGATVTPPTGYTSNLRNSVAANLVLKPQYGGTTLRSPYTHVPVGYAGISSDNAAGLVAAAGTYNLDLPNSLASGGLSSLLSNPQVKSWTLGGRHKFGANVEAYVDASSLMNLGRGSVISVAPTSTTLAATAPNNPFTTAVLVAYPITNLSYVNSTENDSARLAAGVVVRLPRNWTLGADYTFNRSRYLSTAVSNIVGDPDGTGPLISYTTALSTGAVDVLKDLNAYPLNYTPYLMPKPARISDFTTLGQEATLRAAGPVWELPAGPINVAMSVDWRQEAQPSVITETPTTVPSTFTWFPRVNTNQGAAYLEARVPVFSEKSNTLLRALDFQASVRYDTYRSKGLSSGGMAVVGADGPIPTTHFPYRIRKLDATSCLVGFKYSPTKDIALRASWGTGFLPPTLGQLTNPTILNQAVTVVDPKRGNVSAATGIISLPVGGNPDLNPEYSKNLSAGVILTPRFLPGFRLSVDYTQIRKRDEISSLTLQQELDLEDVVPGLVTRAPLTDADRELGYTGGRITALGGFRSYNIAKREVEAIDIQMDYEKQLGSFGNLRPYLMATYQLKSARQLVPSAPFVNGVGCLQALRRRGNAGLDWKRGRWSAGWNMQYYDSYLNYSANSTAATIAAVLLNQRTTRVPSQVYHDLYAGYDFGAQSTGWRRYLSYTRVTLGVQNFLNTMPPLFAGTAASESYASGFLQGISTYGDPRLARYTLTLRKKF
ncbi:MAG: TonB-dependent receptor [Opitutaceae bacterium]|nr:TonB-dependent receptor [Opitutaceae bacterium]